MFVLLIYENGSLFRASISRQGFKTKSLKRWGLRKEIGAVYIELAPHCKHMRSHDVKILLSSGGLLSAFAGSFEFFTFSRFLSGLGVGGSIPVVWSYFAEFQIARNRGTMLSLLACSWMVGNIITGNR